MTKGGASPDAFPADGRRAADGSVPAGGAPLTRLGASGPGAPQTLADLPVGAEARVAGVDAAGAASRLLEMGLTPGAVVRVVRTAPLGDPIEVRVRGYFLSVRREDARRVRLAP